MTAAEIVTVAHTALRQTLDEQVPEATDEVLARVASLRYSGDLHGYLKTITAIAADVCTPILQAKVDAMRAEVERLQLEVEASQARHARWLREWKQFLALHVDNRIH